MTRAGTTRTVLSVMIAGCFFSSACGLNHSNRLVQVSKEIVSWTATASMAVDGFRKGNLPRHYVIRTLDNVRKELQRNADRLQDTSGADEQRSALIFSAQQFELTLSSIQSALENRDAHSLEQEYLKDQQLVFRGMYSPNP